MKPRLSVRDLARHLKLSHTTVSLALRNDPRLTAATRRKVQRAARELGYRTDAVVSSLMAQLRTLRTKPGVAALGFVTAWPTRDAWRRSSNHQRFFDGAAKRARELGYSLTDFWLKEAGMTPGRMRRILLARGIRGLIVHSLPHAGGRLDLECQHFACVTKGLTVTHPPMHRVVSTHFEDMQLVLNQLAARRYARVGLVLSEALSVRVDRAWLAAYLLRQNEISPLHRVPALILKADEGEPHFNTWFAGYQPDAILYSDQPVTEWVEKQNLRVPADVGLVHLDWSRELQPLAGLDSDPEALGEAAVNLLVGQLQANEFGEPRHEKIVAVRGHWVNGRSVRAR